MTPFRFRPSRSRVQAAAAMGVLTLLAACGSTGGSQQGRPMTARAAAEAAAHPQPASYDPPGPPSDPWGPYIREASARFDVPERWIREVMRQESAGRVNARSPVGAMGLMQVMPGTYAELRARYGLGEDPYHPWNSLMAGTAYVREMYELYGSPAFLAAYNAGPRRLEDYLWSSRGLPAETRNYVARIGPRIIDAHPNRRAAPEVYAAAEIPLNIPAGPRRGDTATMLALREQRDAVQPGIQVAQLPPGPITRMEPIPDGSTYASTPAPAPVQVASLSGPVVRMDPIPDGSTYASSASSVASGGVVRMDPIPDGSTYNTAPEPAPVQMASLPVPPPAAPAPAAVPSMVGSALAARAPAPAPQGNSAASTLAALRASQPVTEPPRGPAPRPTSEPVLAEAPSSSRGFRLVSTANAGTLGTLRLPAQGSSRSTATPVAMPSAAASSGQWGVQVGAFASANLARTASDQARGQINARGAKTAVESVSTGRATLYRARVTGLSREAAQSACEKLRTRGACIIVSPEAQ